MEIAEILREFERFNGKFARAAEAAVARREEITPELLRVLEDAVDRAAQLDAEGDYMAHLYAMFLLAQFRETRAYPLVVRFVSLPSDLLDSLCGDFLTGGLGQVLPSVCGGELAGIQSLIENEDTDQWVRGSALSSLVTLVATGQKNRDEIVSYFTGLFRGKLARRWSHVWDALVSYSSDLYPEELFDDIKQAYKEGLVDLSYIGFDDVERDLAEGKDAVLARLAADPNRRLIDDTVAEMGWWACFREDRPGYAKNTAQAPAYTKLDPGTLVPRSTRSKWQRRRSAGTNHVHAGAVRSTRSAVVHKRAACTVHRRNASAARSACLRPYSLCERSRCMPVRQPRSLLCPVLPMAALTKSAGTELAGLPNLALHG